MSRSERRREFEAAAGADALVSLAIKFHRLLSASNSAKVIGGGVQFGFVNLDNVGPAADCIAFAGTVVLSPVALRTVVADAVGA